MFQRLAMAPDPATAGLLHSLLSDAGISVLDVDLTPITNLAFGDSGYYVEVDEKQFEQAAAILREQGEGKWILP